MTSVSDDIPYYIYKTTMKKIILFLCACTLGFVSCSDDNEEDAPSAVKEKFIGTYLGTANSVPTWHRTDTLKNVSYATVDGSKIVVQQFPVAGVVDSIFGKGTAAAQGITTQSLNISYKMYNADASYYPINYTPEALTFSVPTASGTHTVKMQFATNNSSDALLWYYPSTNKLEMWLQTSSITVDNERVTHTATYPDSTVSVNFRFPITLLKQ